MADLVCFRAVAYPVALWQTSNPSASRFNRAGEAPTQYLSLHPLGPWAELLRHLRVAREDAEAILDAGGVRHRTWALRIEDDAVDNIGFAHADARGVAPAALVSDDYVDSQAWASVLRADGVAGVRVPSAALPGTENIVLLGAYADSDYPCEPIGRVDIPTSITAERGTALRTLLPLVRLFGEPHPALEAFLAGREYEFVEPSYLT